MSGRTADRPAPDARTRRRRLLALAVGIQAFTAPVPMVAWFFWTYAFNDQVTASTQVSFVSGVVVLGLGVGAVVGSSAALSNRQHRGSWLTFGLATGLAAYAGVLAVATTVSLANDSNGSVTADQPVWTTVLLIVGSAALTVAFIRVAGRALDRALL